MYRDEVPNSVRRLPKEERIRYYERQVSRVLPAMTFIEWLHTGYTPEEMREKLVEIRAEMREVEARIAVLTSSDMQDLKSDLETHVSEIRQIIKCRTMILIGKPDCSGTNYPNNVQELTNLLNRRVAEARAVEDRITTVCAALRIDPKPHLMLHKVMVRR
jgi:KaiC/GvpD/RAD55 family RecA-like ATPase